MGQFDYLKVQNLHKKPLQLCVKYPAYALAAYFKRYALR